MSSPESNKSTASDSTNSSCISYVSETSTIEYQHETWNIYVSRVHELCRQLWPTASKDEEFVIEKLRGGSSHRAIGIEPPSSTGDSHDRYVLRIPRFQFRTETAHARQAREMAIVRYVRQHTSIPTAKIVFSDSTIKNPLEDPYVVQSRIPGQDLLAVYPTLTHQQKLAIAEQWGQMLLSEFAIRNDFAGIVDASTDGIGAYIRPFVVYPPEPEDEPQDVGLLSKQSVLGLLTSQFERWPAADQRAYSNDVKMLGYEALTTVAQQMDAVGLFKDVYFCLCHLDLAPRNVMVEIKPDNSVRISGVLDWDSAVFGPNFTTCEPPSWIWAWSEDEDEDEEYEEIHANDTPATPENQELKHKFEEVVGKDMLKFFYAPQYRLARSLFNVALHGLRSSEAFKLTERVLKDWEEMHPRLTGSSPPLGPVHEATQSRQLASMNQDLAGIEDIQEAIRLVEAAKMNQDPAGIEDIQEATRSVEPASISQHSAGIEV
ncbi:MAG: hypothetical protein Q9200_000481 [Gallowayella weberi]